MRRSLNNAVVGCASLILMLAAVAAIYPGGASVVVANEFEEEFLGYEIGEERRYVIGPENAMRRGEETTWSIRLERVVQEGGLSVGVFDLAHEEKRWGVSLKGSMFVHWKFSGELRVNEYGFPQDLRFSMYEEHTGESPWRGATMSAAYTFDNGEFVKELRMPDQEWSFDVPIARHDALDLSIPAGLFLFRPEAGGTDFFTNPAMLGFAIPDVVPDEWERRQLFFQPSYPVRYMNARQAQFERNGQASVKRYYSKRTLKAGSYQQLEIGGRTLNVRKIDITGTLRGAYVDEFGRVVRVDLDPDRWTRRDRYVRLLFPSEY